MTKRIVSGLFILVALGALGLILAGALTSGEQLVVRFLTAIIVAAVGLYVISDLRLQADDEAVAVGHPQTAPTARPARPIAGTAAFMPTVTGKKPAPASPATVDLDDLDELSGTVWATGDDASHEVDQLAMVGEPLVRLSSQVRPDWEGPGEITATARPPNGHPRPLGPIDPPVSVKLNGHSPYDDDQLPPWPLTPEGQPVDGDAITNDDAIADGPEADGLDAIFGRSQADREHRGDGDSTAQRPPAVGLGTRSGIEVASYTRPPIAPIIDLRCSTASVPGLDAAIRSAELEAITSLIEQGHLSTEGPISDRDVRTMIYVAFTSGELRKILLAGGTLDGDNRSLDLGTIQLFNQQASRPSLPSASEEPAIDPHDPGQCDLPDTASPDTDHSDTDHSDTDHLDTDHSDTDHLDTDEPES